MGRSNISSDSETGVKFTPELLKEKNEAGENVYNSTYTLKEKLAQDGLCTVVRAEGAGECAGRQFVLKVYRKAALRAQKQYFRKKGSRQMQVRDELMKVMESEVKSYLKLTNEAGGHKNIVHLHEIIDDQGLEDKLVLAMEYCPQGEILSWEEEKEEFVPSPKLTDDKGFLPEEVVKRAFVDIVEGLNFMHSNGVLHRDIKPQNILIDFDGVAKIADFGVSKVLEEDSDIVK